MTANAGKSFRGRLGFAAMSGAVVLVVGAKAAIGHDIGTPSTVAAPSGTTSSTQSPDAAQSPEATQQSGSSGSSGSSAASRTVVGDTVNTRFGPVQVEVVWSGSQIIDVIALQLPEGNPRDRAINDRAVPVLRQEVLDAQSAQIDTVSGASYTSDGYASSVQSALDQAGG